MALVVMIITMTMVMMVVMVVMMMGMMMRSSMGITMEMTVMMVLTKMAMTIIMGHDSENSHDGTASSHTSTKISATVTDHHNDNDNVHARDEFYR